MYPEPTIIYEMPTPLWLRAVHAVRRMVRIFRRLPRSIAELSPEQRVIYAALRQGVEGGLTVSIPVSVQDRRMA